MEVIAHPIPPSMEERDSLEIFQVLLHQLSDVATL